MPTHPARPRPLRSLASWLVLALLMAIAAPVTFAAELLPEKVCTLRWGAAAEEVGLAVTLDGHYGPPGFDVESAARAFLLDAVKQRVLILEEGAIRGQVAVAAGARDLLRYPDGRLVVLYDDRIEVRDGTGAILAQREFGQVQPVPIRLWRDTADTFAVELAGGQSLVLPVDTANLAAASNASRAGIVAEGAAVESRVTGEDTGVAVVRHSAGAWTTFPVVAAGLASLQVIGGDGRGRLYLEVERILGQAPLAVAREVWSFDREGGLLGRLALPPVTHAYAAVDLRLDAAGNLYHLLRSPAGVTLYRWRLEDDPDARPAAYPPQVGAGSHYNLLLASVADGEATMAAQSPVAPADLPVTRSEVAAVADTYVKHRWTARACNIGVRQCDGKTVETPSWVVAGTLDRVVYKWGGFSSLADFDGGLSQCKAAGDKNTTGGGVSCAVGVDCSGFVSRCWKTSKKYGTSTLHEVSEVIAVGDLKTGDALNKAGSHVRLFLGRNPNGTWNMAESYAGNNAWRVDYTVRTAADNSGYTPRRYHLIRDDSTGTVSAR